MGVDHSQVTDIRDLHLDRAANEVFGGQADYSREKIHLLHLPAPRALSHLTCPMRRIIERGNPDLPTETLGKIHGKNGVADEIGIGRHSGRRIERALDLQMIGPEGERLTAHEKAAW